MARLVRPLLGGAWLGSSALCSEEHGSAGPPSARRSMARLVRPLLGGAWLVSSALCSEEHGSSRLPSARRSMARLVCPLLRGAWLVSSALCSEEHGSARLPSAQRSMARLVCYSGAPLSSGARSRPLCRGCAVVERVVAVCRHRRNWPRHGRARACRGCQTAPRLPAPGRRVFESGAVALVSSSPPSARRSMARLLRPLLGGAWLG